MFIILSMISTFWVKIFNEKNPAYWPCVGVWVNADILTLLPLTRSRDAKGVFDQSDNSSQNHAPDPLYKLFIYIITYSSISILILEIQASLTLQETRSIQDSMNLSKIEFIS